jgi:hypothetical protein
MFEELDLKIDSVDVSPAPDASPTLGCYTQFCVKTTIVIKTKCYSA